MPNPPEDTTPDKLITEQLEIMGTVETYTTVLSAVVELMELLAVLLRDRLMPS